MLLLVDDETQTYWDHICGEAVHGPLKGYQLDFWRVQVCTVAEALERNPAPRLHRSERNWKTKVASWFIDLLGWSPYQSPMFFPPGFRGTLEELDQRLPPFTRGLGIVVGERAVFIPKACLTQERTLDFEGRELTVSAGPRAVAMWSDGRFPFQIQSRWYGFSNTYRDCELYGNCQFH